MLNKRTSKKKIFCQQFCDLIEKLGDEDDNETNRDFLELQYHSLLDYDRGSDFGMTMKEFSEFDQIDRFFTEESDDIHVVRNVAIGLEYGRTQRAVSINDDNKESPSDRTDRALQKVVDAQTKYTSFRLKLISFIWGNPWESSQNNSNTSTSNVHKTRDKIDDDKKNNDENSEKDKVEKTDTEDEIHALNWTSESVHDEDSEPLNPCTFEFFILVIILINIIILIIDLFISNAGIRVLIRVVDIMILAIFMIEIILKCIALGYKAYFFKYLKDFVNFIDFGVTIVLVITEILLYSWLYQFVIVARTFRFIKLERLLKTCKVLKIIGKFPQFLKSAKKTFIDGIAIFIVLFCLCYVYAVIGCYAFNNVITEEYVGNECIDSVSGDPLSSEFWCEMYDAFYFENNFNTFLHGLVIQLIMMIGNNWDIVVKMFLKANSKDIGMTIFTYIYFLTVFFSLLLIINVLTAFIIDVFDDNYRYFKRLASQKHRGHKVWWDGKNVKILDAQPTAVGSKFISNVKEHNKSVAAGLETKSGTPSTVTSPHDTMKSMKDTQSGKSAAVLRGQSELELVARGVTVSIPDTAN